MPVVTVVISTYNYANYLPRALDSVQNQTFPRWECIVIDDASTDNTADIVAPYLKDPRFRYLRNDVNSGVDISRNRANALANGKYIACLDGDDWWEADKLKLQLEAFAEHPEAAVCFTAVNSVADSGITVYRPEQWWLSDMNIGLKITNEINHSSSLVQRDAIQAEGGYNPLLPGCGDWNFFLKLMKTHGSKGFIYVDQPLTNYRWHTANLSHDWSRRNWSERAIIKANLTRGAFWFMHPVTSIRIIRGQADRELRRYMSGSDHYLTAKSAIVALLLAPARRWRWRQFLGVLFQRTTNSASPTKHG